MPDNVLRQPIVFTISLTALIFIFDFFMPLGVAGGVSYVIPVLLGVWFPRRRHVFALAAVGTLLTFLGFFLSPAGGISWVVFTNRALALFLIWVTALLVLIYKSGSPTRDKIVPTTFKDKHRIFALVVV